MKKLLFSALILGLVFTTSCNKDDDGGGNQCKTCEMSIFGTAMSSQYCDNGDGTVTMTTDGESEIVSLEGVSFDQFISSMQQAGFTCN